MVSPAPCVPTFSSTRPCFLKMPASWPSVGAWFSQLLICPIATLSVVLGRSRAGRERQRHDQPERADDVLEGLHAVPPCIFYSFVCRPTVGGIQHRVRPRGKPKVSSPPRFAAAARLWPRRARLWPWPAARPASPPALATRIDQYSHERVSPVVLALIWPASCGLARRQRGDVAADRQRPHLVLGIARRIDRSGTRNRARWCRRR